MKEIRILVREKLSTACLLNIGCVFSYLSILDRVLIIVVTLKLLKEI